MTPHHLLRRRCLENLVAAPTAGAAYTVGELYLFSMLHQMVLVGADSAMGSFPKLQAFYNGVEAHPVTQKVLAGKSNMGVFRQYFQTKNPEPK